MLYFALLRSPFAHAKITNIDVSGALEQPGVEAAYTGADLADEWPGGVPCAWPLASAPGAWTVTDEMKDPGHAPLAMDEVRYMGDAVAVVVASDRYAAQDALEFIEIDYEPLGVVTNMEAALEEDSPLVHEELGTNQCYTWELGDNEAVDQAFSDADVVINERYIQQRLIPNAIEPRAVVVQREPGHSGSYLVYSATQIPHITKTMLSMATGIPENKIRVVAPDVGGGFGSKLNVYAEEILALVLCKKLRTAVKWSRGPLGELPGDHPRSRPGPGHRVGGDQRRQDPRYAGEGSGRHGRVPAAPDPRHPGSGRLYVPRRLHLRGVLLSRSKASSPT